MGIVIDNIFLTSADIKRKVQVPDSVEFNIKYQIQIFNDEKKIHSAVKLSANVIEKEERFTISAEIEGQFHCDENGYPLPIDEFLRVNAPSIIMPYLRENISSLATRAGLPRVFLPTVNFREWYERDKAVPQQKELKQAELQ